MKLTTLYGPTDVTHINHGQRLYQPRNGILEVEPHLVSFFAPFGFTTTPPPEPKKGPEKKDKAKE